jgi:predicted nucleic acid-binding protein
VILDTNAVSAFFEGVPAVCDAIAALVRQHGLPLLSNDAHFDHVGGVIRIAWK